MRNRRPIGAAVIAVIAFSLAACGRGAKGTVWLGRGELRIGINRGTGLISGIESRTGGRARSWLSAPLTLGVKDELTGRLETVSISRIRKTADGAEATAAPGSPVSLSHTLRVLRDRAEWSLAFLEDGERSGHEVMLELPVLFPEAQIFTPSQYGVMDARVYPTFRPVPYAKYSWDDGQSYVLPLVIAMDAEADEALTIALPLDDNIPHLQVEWADARLLRLSMGRRGMGGGRPSPLRVLFYVHPADYRSALEAYASDFPSYFRPGLPRGPHEGTFWYHHILDHPDFEEMARQRVRYIWSSFWFTHMGEFLPEAKTWHPYTYARWWNRKETMSDARINGFIGTMRARGIGTYAYFNVTEFGGAGGLTGGTADADRLIREKFPSALVRDAAGREIPTWEESKVINPRRDGAYWPWLEEQVRRHLDRLPDFDGFIVDRLDWASRFDYGHDDGLSMDGARPVENLAVPVGAAVAELCRLSHAAGKRVFVNQFWRGEVVRDSDGYCHENDYLPAMAYLAPFRPASAWHIRRSYSGDLLPFEGQLKRRLHWALFPQFIAHEFPVSQQNPDPWAADLMEIFAPAFAPLLGKEQVLRSHCVSVTRANDANLFVNGAGHYVAPVTSRVRFLSRPPAATERTEVKLRVPDAADLAWAHVISVDGAPYTVPVQIAEDGTARVTLERHGTSSVVIVGRGPEPPLDAADAERLEALRRRIFPSQAARVREAARPDLKDIRELTLHVSAVSIGASGPSTVVEVLVDGRRAGEIRDTAVSFRETAPASSLPEQPPVISLVPGDEGAWLVAERIELIARNGTGEAWTVASWETGDPSDAEGERGVRFPLAWRAPTRSVAETK